jgi:Phosphate-selective porin O and P
MASGVLRRLLRAAVCLCALGLARTAGAQAAPPKPLTLGRITLAGYLQLDYLTPIEGPRVQPPLDDPLVEDETVVDVARARVSASGQLGSRVTWLVMGDFAALPENVLRDASVTVRLAPAASVRLGQYSIPFSFERKTSAAVIETIDRSILGTALTPSRDLGVTVFSPAPIRGWFMYWGSVIAGAGANTPDNNGARDLVGRVAIRPPQAKGLSIGVNGETGKQPVGDRRRAGIDVSYEHGPVRLVVEALSQSIDGAIERDTRGYYVLGVWHRPAASPRPWFAGYELATRWVDVDDDADLLTSHTLQFGGNYYVTPQIRLMNNLVLPIGNDQPRTRTRWWSRLQVVF